MSGILYQNSPFNPVRSGALSVAKVDKYIKTLLGARLTFGAMDKSDISEISVLLGARQIVGPVTGLELDAMNRYKGLPVDATRLSLDLCERGFSSRNYNRQIAEELGGIDIPSIGGDDIFVHVKNTLAGADPDPTLDMRLVLGDLQTAPGNRDPNSTVIKKIKSTQVPGTGSVDVVWTPELRGAQLLRVHFSTPTDGNIKSVNVTKNNVPIHQTVKAGDNAAWLLDHGLVPQENYYHYDPCADKLLESWITTADALSLKFELQLTTVEPVRAIYEVIDLPFNL